MQAKYRHEILQNYGRVGSSYAKFTPVVESANSMTFLKPIPNVLSNDFQGVICTTCPGFGHFDILALPFWLFGDLDFDLIKKAALRRNSRKPRENDKNDNPRRPRRKQHQPPNPFPHLVLSCVCRATPRNCFFSRLHRSAINLCAASFSIIV